ncbi:related to RSA4-WD-repeat protein required for maturation and efficient intra-nuclear transport [Fusarium oxysporum]|uniref:Mitochondrial division protein 1 n=1 Tax=Fusarium oxysporum TaxID=5507 RepID=A0A2H3TFB7_FUSOX|nr:related to RSA4-WD-repeat protein required for maturation and efficient intra-nuclear transport [Fusarium oxysporum]
MAEALGVASSVIAVVDLSAKVFSLCLQYSQEVKNAKDDIERLRKEVAAFQDSTKKLQALVEGPRGKELSTSQQLVSAIEDGRLKLEKLGQQLQPPTHRKVMSRLGARAFKWPFESKDVERTIQNLERCRENISLALNIDQTVILQNVDDRTTLNQLPLAHGASFDSKAEEHNPTCLPDTREELLKEIDRWIDNPKSKTIFWLNGMAGTGKSTISRTVAHSRSKRGDLGASFFFKRGEMDRGNLNKLMSTLAYQLASSIPGVAFFIKKTLDTNSAVVGKSVREQFQKLIQEPLSEAAASTIAMSPVVMVIDALDECDQEADIRLLINIFSQAKTVLPQLRVFLTSRPELPIRLGFSEAQGSYRDLVLHEIPAETIEHDIFIFLNDEFQKVRDDFNKTVSDERKLPTDWPGRPTVERLAQMAVPLFIFAATVCRFVGNSRRRDPRTRLQTVLDQGRKSHGKQLEQTYLPVLLSQITALPREEREEVIEDFKVIVGSIVTLASPLSVTTLSRLIDVLPDVVDERLDELHSVLSIPLERKIPVRMLHLSFRDYLVDPGNKERNEFWVDEKVTHRRLAKQCLRVMRGVLRENICGLPFPEGHSSSVNLVVFSHDSKKVASASDDKVIRIWDAETGECERVLEGHSDCVSSAVFSHDSKKVASASDDNTVRIWNVETGECERIIEHHSGLIYSMVFSYDLMMLALTSDDKEARVWHLKTGECIEAIPMEHYSRGLSFTKDSRGLVTSTGIIPLTRPPVSLFETAAVLRYTVTSFLRLRSDTWIMMGGKDLLWLPAECRDGKTAISGGTVVVGCQSGRVVLLRFSAEDIPKIAS